MSVREALRQGGAGARDAAAQAPLAEAAMLEAGIVTQDRSRYFLAQVLHESGGLYYRQELWGPTPAQSGYEGRRDLGNVRPGDGYRYRGRGWIQLTGRENYRLAGKALGIDLVDNPDLASTSAVAWRIAAWYWSTRGLNAYADRRDFEGVTKRINGGYNGLDDRRRRLSAISDVDCRPRDTPLVRPIRLTKPEKEVVELVQAKRRIRIRNGNTWKGLSDSHKEAFDEGVWWLREHATAMSLDRTVKDKDYRNRKVDYLRDVAFNRDGRGH